MTRDPLTGMLASVGLYGVPYKQDAELFEQLRFPRIPDLPHAEDILVGVYVAPNPDRPAESYWKATVWVQAWPSLFWRIVIETSEGAKYQVTTGSGSLSTYWPTVVRIGESMINVVRL